MSSTVLQIHVPVGAIPGTTMLRAQGPNGPFQVKVPADAVPGVTLLQVAVPEEKMAVVVASPVQHHMTSTSGGGSMTPYHSAASYLIQQRLCALTPSYDCYQLVNGGRIKMFTCRMLCIQCCGSTLNIYSADNSAHLGRLHGDICNIVFTCSDSSGNVLGSLEFPWCPGPCFCQGYPFELYVGEGASRRHLHAESSICLPWTFDVANEQGQIEMRLQKQIAFRDQMHVTVDPPDRILPALAMLVAVAIDIRYYSNNNNNCCGNANSDCSICDVCGGILGN